MTSGDKQIKYTLELIKEQTGIEVKLCDHFKGINMHNGRRYFNVALSEMVSDSLDYTILCDFARNYKLISVEPNGVKRVAVYLNE